MRVGIYSLHSCYWPVALAQCIRQIPGAELVAAAHLGFDPALTRDILGVSPEDFAQQFSVPLYEDPQTMIEREGVEAVLIAGPHTELPGYCEQAAGLGCHFYVSKPMAVSTAGAERIVEAAQEAGVVAVSGMTERFDPGIRAAQQRIAAGEIGEVIAIRALHQHGRLSFHPRDWWNDPEQGGPELSLMWYVADVCRWLAGSEVTRVYAEYGTFNSPGSPFMDNGKATFRFANGVLGSADIYFSCDFEFPHWEVEVMGTTGAIRTQQSAYSVTAFGPGGPRVSVAPAHDMLRDEVANWLAACRGEGETFMRIRDARQVLEVCFAARESAQAHQPVELPVV
jgi:myo-inositol 2-dehydrogenase / D-chiro-inositol 1-dehydrogenase